MPNANAPFPNAKELFPCANPPILAKELFPLAAEFSPKAVAAFPLAVLHSPNATA